MRNTVSLLKVMLENKKYFHTGMCAWATSLYASKIITEDEVDVLSKYILDNRPSKFSSIAAYKNRDSSYYWEKGNINYRIKWIKRHIRKLS